MWTVELTVGDHEKNGFVHLARWQFPDEASARTFIEAENAAIPEGAEPDAKTDAFTHAYPVNAYKRRYPLDMGAAE